jgi:hypothetical protein
VDRAEENVAAVSQRLADLEAEFRAEAETLERSFDPTTEQLDTVSLKPTKANINVKLLTLVWAPYWHGAQGEARPAWE